MGRNEMLLEIFAYPTVTVVHFRDQNCISKTEFSWISCIVLRVWWSVKYFLLQIPDEDGENRQKQGVLPFKLTKNLGCVHSRYLLY